MTTVKRLVWSKKPKGGMLVTEVTEPAPKEKPDFTKEVLKRMASNMTIDISDLETAPIVEEPVK